VVVVKPEKPVKPVVDRNPVLPSRTEAAPQEDLGELSSIFAGTEGNEEPAPYGGSSIPLGPTDDVTAGGKEDGGEGKLTDKWWFWAGVAAGAGLVGGGGYLIYDQVSGGSEATKYSAGFAWQP
jgi:hypothetical protein